MNRNVVFCLLFGLCGLLAPLRAFDFGSQVIVSVHDQQLVIVNNGEVQAKYPISTSKYGLGDDHGSYKTPLGTLWVCNKIGDNLAPGTVIKNRNATGEIVSPNAPGRDPIVTRVIWLRGLEDQNRNAYERCIYIHGTPEEKLLGKPASYGCIRMRSRDVVRLFDTVGVGTKINILNVSLGRALNAMAFGHHHSLVASVF